jgi:hypothetical protein
MHAVPRAKHNPVVFSANLKITNPRLSLGRLNSTRGFPEDSSNLVPTLALLVGTAFPQFLYRCLLSQKSIQKTTALPELADEHPAPPCVTGPNLTEHIVHPSVNSRAHLLNGGRRLLVLVFRIPANYSQPLMNFFMAVIQPLTNVSGYTIIWNGLILEPFSFVTEMIGRREIGNVVASLR